MRDQDQQLGYYPEIPKSDYLFSAPLPCVDVAAAVGLSTGGQLTAVTLGHKHAGNRCPNTIVAHLQMTWSDAVCSCQIKEQHDDMDLYMWTKALLAEGWKIVT